jgi:hypothetical protein
VPDLEWAKAALAAGIFVLLAVVYGVAHRQPQCLLFNAPPLFLIGFAVAATLQQPILRALRNTGRAGVALAALLVFEAAIMFAIGEWMAIGHYSKGLKHFQDEKQSYWSIATTAGADFFIDYARREVVLQGRTSAGAAIDIRNPLTGFSCRSP